METTKEKRILIVDDEPKIVSVLKSYLEKSGYEVFEAFEGIGALAMFEKVAPSLVILDLMLPDISGEEICKSIRTKSNIPIIMLTAKIEEEDLINGLNIGADDYVTKPFSPREIVARVGAAFRRLEDNKLPASDMISFNNGELVIEKLKHEVRLNGVNAGLTNNEFNILLTMVKHPSKVFTREELISIALGNEFDGFDRVIDTHIKNIRQKIEVEPKSPKYIVTVHGVGYRFGGL